MKRISTEREKIMRSTNVNTNWPLHAEAIDDEPSPQSRIQQSQKLFFAKKKSTLTKKVKKTFELLFKRKQRICGNSRINQ